MTLSEYAHLKEQVQISVGSSERHGHLLISLKECFRETINSSRRFEQINTIGYLLNVLEIRDCLSEDNVEPLKDIVEKLPNSLELMRKIVDYQVSHVPREYVNYYASKKEETPRIENNNRQQIESVINTNPVGAFMSDRKRQRINETLTEEIGVFWRDLGRNLKIREGVIDDIDKNNISTIRKAKKLMEMYERKADPQRWFFVLCDALEKARRRDLSRSLQEIMSMNI